MKKLMYIAAALLVLVGCQKKENVIENAPQNLVTITGGIDFSAQDGPNKVAAKDGWENVTSGNKVEFVWEEDDKIAVTDFTEVKQFTVTSISEDKQTATFTGEPLSSGMEGYMVFYPYEYGEAMVNGQDRSFLASQQYSEKLRPYIVGSSKEDGTFTMNIFCGVMDLSLTGSDKLGKMVYHIDKDEYDQPYDVTLSFGNGGLQLTNEPKHVTFTPYFFGTDGFKLSFYDTNNQLIMEKKSETEFTNKILLFSFPTLEVKADPYNSHEYVNLGLSVKWATMNVGATAPTEYGDFLAWGETAPYYSSLSPLTWKEDKTNGYGWLSYCGQSSFSEWNPAPYDDNKILKPEYDAARQNWQGAWRTPTKAEWEELMNKENCEWKWCDGETEKYNNTTVKGYLVTSLKESYAGNSIFLPASGFLTSKNNFINNGQGNYWSSSLYENTGSAYYYFFSSSKITPMKIDYYGRCVGLSVRPVCPIN